MIDAALTTTDSHHITEILPFADGGIVPSVDFDFDEIDKRLAGLPEDPSDRAESLADSMRAVLAWVWRDGKHAQNLNAAFVRFVAMSAVLNPELLDGQTYKEIGARIGRTRAAVSKNALNFQDYFGVHFRRSRREGTRETFREAALGNHNRRDAAKKL